MITNCVFLTDLVEGSHSDGHFDAVLAVPVRGLGPHGAAGRRPSWDTERSVDPRGEPGWTVSSYMTTAAHRAQRVRPAGSCS